MSRRQIGYVLVVKFLMVFGNGGLNKMLQWLVPKNGHAIER